MHLWKVLAGGILVTNFSPSLMQIVLDTYGLSLSVRNRCFLITKEKGKRLIHPSRVTSILVTMPCSISTPAILLAVANQIALTICSASGKPEALIWSSRLSNTSALRRKQYQFSQSQAGWEWAKETIIAKIENQSANLSYLSDLEPAVTVADSNASEEIDKLIQTLEKVNITTADCLKKIRFIEAISAKLYWPQIGACLPTPFSFTLRAKTNATDSFNPAINYLYGMLRNHIETGILSFGLDPSLGCMHRDGYNLPSLVFDFMEPFRPIIDKILIESVLEGRIKEIAEPEEGVFKLTRDGRKKLIGLFNNNLGKTMIYEKTRTTLSNYILLEIKQLAGKIREYEA